MGTLAAWREGTIVIRSEAKKAKAEIIAIWNQGMAYAESEVGNSSEVMRK